LWQFADANEEMRDNPTVISDRRFYGMHSIVAWARFWPIAEVEFSDVANHVNCTTRQRSRSAAA
jgi:hypothetical protein